MAMMCRIFYMAAVTKLPSCLPIRLDDTMEITSTCEVSLMRTHWSAANKIAWVINEQSLRHR